MRRLGRFSVPADHPCLSGHFPGSPIVPAVLMLDAIIGLILPRCPGVRLAGIAQARFLVPVLPEQTVELEAALPEQVVELDAAQREQVARTGTSILRVGFAARVEEKIVVRGSLDLRHSTA